MELHEEARGAQKWFKCRASSLKANPGFFAKKRNKLIGPKYLLAPQGGFRRLQGNGGTIKAYNKPLLRLIKA
jgi:hypothetical protein